MIKLTKTNLTLVTITWKRGSMKQKVAALIL